MCLAGSCTFMIAANWTPNPLSACGCQHRQRQTGRQAGRQADQQADGRTDRQTDRQTDMQPVSTVSWQHAASAMQWLFLSANDLSISLFMQLECSKCSNSSAAYIACAAMQCPDSPAGAYKPGLSQLLDPTLINVSRAALLRCIVHHH